MMVVHLSLLLLTISSSLAPAHPHHILKSGRPSEATPAHPRSASLQCSAILSSKAATKAINPVLRSYTTSVEGAVAPKVIFKEVPRPYKFPWFETIMGAQIGVYAYLSWNIWAESNRMEKQWQADALDRRFTNIETTLEELAKKNDVAYYPNIL